MYRKIAKTLFLIVAVFATAYVSCSDKANNVVDPVDVSADTVSNIRVTDNGENGNGSDLTISFNQAADESKIAEYRVIVVKGTNAATFDLSVAEALTATRYASVAKTGSPLTVTLAANAQDSDGQVVQNGVVYRIFVLSIADGTNANLNALSAPSPEIILEIMVRNVGTASNITVADIGNDKNGADLEVSFDRAADESELEEYRVLVVKAGSSSSFTLEQAEAVSAANSTSVAKGSNAVQTALAAGAADIDGEPVGNEVPYRIFVLSKAIQSEVLLSALSPPSEEITLISQAESVGNLTISDVGGNGTGSDIRVQFDAVQNEKAVAEYRIIVVKSAQADGFDLSAAEVVAEGNYTAVAVGSATDVTLADDARDSDGDVITAGTPYRVFVLTAADGTVADINALAGPSEEFTLEIVNIEITYLHNDGVLISTPDGQTQVLVDALASTNLQGWVQMPVADRNRLYGAQAPFDQIDVALATHNHGDHYSPNSVLSHLNANASTVFVGPPQITNGLPVRPQVIRVAGLPRFDRRMVTASGVDIEVLSLRHFNAFGNDFSGVENFGFIVHIGGMKVLHLGDLDMASDNFKNWDLETENIDVVLIPTFVNSVHLTNANRDALVNDINPEHIIALHLIPGQISQITPMIRQVYPEAIIFTSAFQRVSF